jgi:hypothetical protein
MDSLFPFLQGLAPLQHAGLARRPLSLRQVDPLIRELSQYRDLIQQRINFEETQS